jgi:tyrosyl-tRNA synthetase
MHAKGLSDMPSDAGGAASVRRSYAGGLMSVPVLTPEEQLERLAEGVLEIIREDELLAKLARARDEGRPLIVKQGFDPSAPDLHLGHAIGLRKLRQFQDLGHRVVVVIGDYTGMVGDPSERSDTRPRLTHDQVLENARTYQEQLGKVVDRDPSRLEVVMNGQWFGRMSFADVMDLAGRHTVARILERDDFARRFGEHQPISIHELFYPLMQGYDSVQIEADVELGATDQKFNCLLGRELQKAYGQEPQIVMLTPVLEGTDGVRRMSKSTGNYIGIAESPTEMYGKTMSIPDGMIMRYFELATTVPPEEVEAVRSELVREDVNPRDLKRRLARTIVETYHGGAAAAAAEDEFDRVFRGGGPPDEIPEPLITLRGQESLDSIWIVALIVGAGLAGSNGEARRLIEQGGIRLDGVVVTDVESTVSIDRPRLLQAGKRRFVRVVPGNVSLGT